MRRWVPIIIALLLLVLPACASHAGLAQNMPQSSVPTRERIAQLFLTPPPTPEPIQLPDDDAPHDVLTEWWYTTGHLQATDGRQFGFEFVIFQSERFGYPVVYAAHFAITDHQAQQFSWAERVDSHPRPPSTLPVVLSVADWSLQITDNQLALSAGMDNYALQLALRSIKPPVLESPGGFFTWAPATGSYYYSRTRLAVQGTLRVGTADLAVQGQAWMDHQWGNFIVGNQGGWNWFAIQLDDGRDVMLWQTHDTEGSVVLASGTLVDPEGHPQYLSADAFRIQSTDSWQSPHSGALYPSGWKIAIPAARLQLTVTPILQDQELQTVRSTGVMYWEGEVEIAGFADNRPVNGKGYVELTGYARPTIQPSPSLPVPHS